MIIEVSPYDEEEPIPVQQKVSPTPLYEFERPIAFPFKNSVAASKSKLVSSHDMI